MSWHSAKKSERSCDIGPTAQAPASSPGTAKARLIGRHDDAEAGVVEPRDRFQAAGNGAPLVRRLDVLLAVVVDDAVAVQDDQFHLARVRGGIGGELDQGLAPFRPPASRYR